ncbi:relaxase domain-containing protein, partial [Nocardia sp. 852002-20019_SCH5090214]|uniref:relaxase domain-containing protein n=1 Tax=Nocardia sp. 852002-20019_SCH5090214 TaxID=1834087 RepID=UPI0012EAB02C
YYSERGESPGRWVGSGLGALDIVEGDIVTESQMRALFGRGMHPNADAIVAQLAAEQMADGVSPRVARLYGAKMAQLGRPHNRYVVDEAGYRFECARAYAEYNRAQGLIEYAKIPPEVREQIRTDVALTMFAEEFGRPPADDRELSGWIARASRPNTKSVAGFDLTFSPVKSVSALWALAPREIAEKIEAAHYA